jgi:hypothetical protein
VLAIHFALNTIPCSTYGVALPEYSISIHKQGIIGLRWQGRPAFELFHCLSVSGAIRNQVPRLTCGFFWLSEHVGDTTNHRIFIPGSAIFYKERFFLRAFLTSILSRFRSANVVFSPASTRLRISFSDSYFFFSINRIFVLCVERVKDIESFVNRNLFYSFF